MKKYVYKLTAALTTAALLASTFVPSVFAESDLEIVGNGQNSENTIKVEDKCSSVVAQHNDLAVEALVGASSNSGLNQADGNTGDDVEIDTGDAESGVGVEVHGGSNLAEAPDCCKCDLGNLDVSIKENGEDSKNKVEVKEQKDTTVAQFSTAFVGVLAHLKANTGKNRANGNTGGKTEIKTGKAKSFFDVFVSMGSNVVGPLP